MSVYAKACVCLCVFDLESEVLRKRRGGGSVSVGLLPQPSQGRHYTALLKGRFKRTAMQKIERFSPSAARK